MFFFKQKTAYEMRISDWSSDVCSSDLPYLRYWLDTTQAGSFCMVDPPEGRVADWPEEAFRTVRATYWGMISEVDRQIGRLVERLQAAGAWEDRKRVVSGKSVSVRVVLGGRRSIKKQKPK